MAALVPGFAFQQKFLYPPKFWNSFSPSSYCLNFLNVTKSYETKFRTFHLFWLFSSFKRALDSIQLTLFSKSTPGKRSDVRALRCLVRFTFSFLVNMSLRMFRLNIRSLRTSTKKYLVQICVKCDRLNTAESFFNSSVSRSTQTSRFSRKRRILTRKSFTTCLKYLHSWREGWRWIGPKIDPV